MATVEISIDDLEFFEYVGGGSFGSVFRGFWKSKEQIVAIKKHTAPDSSKEVAILSKLSHRNIIQLYGAITVAPHLCFVTDYASKGSLYHHLSQNTLDFPQILTWARHIALGMNYLHNEAPFPVIHRDLKSKNVVLSEDMTAKICDFGCARFMKNTTKMSLAGTFPWMAPEAIQQLTVDHKSDTFSYGVVVWELLTSEVPFKGLEGIQVAWLVVAHGERLTIPASCPDSIAGLMRSCWKDPKDRPDFRDVLAALNHMSEDDQLPDATQTFLSHRKEWRAEIDATLEQLKKVERSLNSREKHLQEREMKLDERERELLNVRGQKPPDDHDVFGWTEEHVAQWIRYIATEGGSGDVMQYADVFMQNNINGSRLLLLGTDELAMMVPSVGHRLEMQAVIDRLLEHNERLRNFPPLAQPASLMRRSSEAQVVNLTVIFGNHFRRGALPDQRKWKMYVELDGPDQAMLCIQCVTFTFAENDVVCIRQPPYLMDKWRSAMKDTETVHCVVDYDSSVKKPRRTACTHTVDFTGSDCTKSQQLSVLLTLKRSMSRASAGSGDTTPSGSTLGSSQPDSSGCNTSEASSRTSSVNSERSRFESLPSLQQRKVTWPALRPSLSENRLKPASASSLNILGPTPVGGPGGGKASPVSPNNPWFNPDNHLHWPDGQPKNVVAQGPTIPSSSTPRRLDGTGAQSPPTRMTPRHPGSGPGPGRGSRSAAHFEHRPAGNQARPLGDSRTLPTGQPVNHKPYRRSVSDAPSRGTGRRLFQDSRTAAGPAAGRARPTSETGRTAGGHAPDRGPEPWPLLQSSAQHQPSAWHQPAASPVQHERQQHPSAQSRQAQHPSAQSRQAQQPPPAQPCQSASSSAARQQPAQSPSNSVGCTGSTGSSSSGGGGGGRGGRRGGRGGRSHR